MRERFVMLRIIGVLVTLLLLGGCATRGIQFSSDTNWINESKTNKADVKSVLGEPYSVGYASEKPTWTYGFYQFRLFGQSFTKELKFYWNRDGTVSKYAYSSSFPEDVESGAKH